MTVIPYFSVRSSIYIIIYFSVRSLIYIIIYIRSDIVYTVNLINEFISNLKKEY